MGLRVCSSLAVREGSGGREPYASESYLHDLEPVA